MEKKNQLHLYNYFSKLVEKYGFIKENEFNENESYSVEYRSKSFVIKIEKYRHEFYSMLYKPGNAKSKVNLFNLLQYINKDNSNVVPESNYFHDEDDLGEIYKKQLNHISSTIYENLNSINEFYNSSNLESKLAEINEFMLSKYPNLFNKD